ncbi:hypothetical protein chiPu_0000234 [Chiloscyllium punctatum]|uniref:Uncharacterized protein n=1 Tax=Chiloscyllium punctatum TaxID=137246 RepID=A0A401RUL6_CHIPU|nr:hypothetical protein [Chiloscyllium punctatum]
MQVDVPVTAAAALFPPPLNPAPSRGSSVLPAAACSHFGAGTRFMLTHSRFRKRKERRGAERARDPLCATGRLVARSLAVICSFSALQNRTLLSGEHQRDLTGKEERSLNSETPVVNPGSGAALSAHSA